MLLQASSRPSPRTLVAVVALAVAASLVGAPAKASDLTMPSASFASAPMASESYLRNGSDGLFASSAGPVRHRSGRRYRYDDDYGYRPRTFASIGIGSFDPSNQPGSGFFATGTIGTELEAPVDIGLSMNWYHRGTGGEQFVTTFTDPAGNTGTRVVEADQIDTDLVPLMAFIRVKFPTGSIEPYVGAGAGWEWLHVEGVDSDGFAFADDYDGFGAQFFGGANFKIAPNTSLYGEVLWNNSTVSADFFDPVYGQDVRDEIDMDGAAAHGGLRFRF